MIETIARVRVFKHPDLHGGHRQRHIPPRHKLAAVSREGDAVLKRINRPAARFLVRAPALSERDNHRARAIQLTGRNRARLSYPGKRALDVLCALSLKRAQASDI